jgi:HlyD family secretion protein
MEQAANALRDRQTEYDRIYWDNQKLREQLGEADFPQELNDREAAALRAVQNAERDLDQARVAYEQAVQAEVTGLANADAQVAQAQASYDKVLTSIDTAQVVAARAQVAQAQANYDKLVRIDPVQRSSAVAQVAQAQANLDKLLKVEPSDLAAARAQVAQAQANLTKLLGDEQTGRVNAAAAGVTNAQSNLEKLTAPAGAPDLASALAEVEAAKVSIKEAELALEQATLRAPMRGTIAEVNLKVGEVPSTDTAAIVIADFSTWQVETTDLTELSVVQISEGDPVTLTFDALPGFELTGKVARIDTIGKNKQGDITYTAIVTPDTQDSRLRWNMTAAVVIDPK